MAHNTEKRWWHLETSNVHCMEFGKVWVEDFEFGKCGKGLNHVAVITVSHDLLRQSLSDGKYDAQWVSREKPVKCRGS